MSVFTTLSLDEVRLWLAPFNVGELQTLRGIAAGITNTNYFVETSESRFVLTVFEKNDFDELPYFVHLMTHLSQHGIQCPSPIVDKDGVALHRIHGKPALMVSCLRGSDVSQPNLTQIEAVAQTLARMHLAGMAFHEQSHNQRGQGWRVMTAQQVMPKLAPVQQHLLQEELQFQHGLDLSGLPHGVIHGDLFRDNVLFDGNVLGGFIDFYYACHDVLAYDVAIAVNEWCVDANGAFVDDKLAVFMNAYHAVRPFTAEEKSFWPALLRRAALRFWLSRLYDFYYPVAGELTHAKDPAHFERVLLNRQALT
ncbi:homoserine kinase [Methylophilus sp. VKM B-3414]|jgi:homoserine kinase type II|uniref:homoserine kinase n=1 Tax=unclassified Methylophilus TaxID=2630143 RepID=UPI0028C54890|nr:homoserine kinase [Methylophilus sp. VKM B-3414]MDT7849024.1 homoserine kinase [Methylophilus sp. VKM B-3414]BEV09030.1 homoserine kinase [Methylophilus sp. DW102]